MHTILLAGAGQLGSRYLQGISAVNIPLTVVVYDPLEKSLIQAKARYDEVAPKNAPHKVIYTKNIFDSPAKIDLAVLAMTSSFRASFMRELQVHSIVKYWLLEKVLATSIQDLEDIEAICSQSKGAWVNHWMREAIFFRELLVDIQSSGVKAFVMKVSGGGWGLACNAIHYIDFCGWLTGSQLVGVSGGGLDPIWVQAKRDGYFEVAGKLIGMYEDGELILTCDESNSPVNISLNYLGGAIEIKFSGEMLEIIDENGCMSSYAVPLQSQTTSSLVSGIFKSGECNLTTYSESINCHKLYINEMLRCWNKSNERNDKSVPIT